MPSVRGLKEENERLDHDHTQLEGGKGEPADSRQDKLADSRQDSRHSKDHVINFNFTEVVKVE